MAKKNKKKQSTAENNGVIDINQSVVNMEPIKSEAEKADVSAKDSEDDEFEQLLNSFLNSDADNQPVAAAEPEKHKDLESLHILPPENSAPVDDFTDIGKKAPHEVVDLGSDESELAQAYENFLGAVSAMAAIRDIALPEFLFRKKMLVPNYKPSVGRKIGEDASLCWDIMLQAFPEKLSAIKPNATDEEFLNFAEGVADQNLQLAIISYVEILIDIENCEISYEAKRLKAQRRRIEKALYDEYQRRKERKQKFIEAVQKRKFPVDAERLIGNYFKTAVKDAEGAYEALTKNPAVYAPIETDKIKPRFFGLIKPTPKDGIRENCKLGKFLKYLRV